MLKLIQSFLNKRHQSVVLNGHLFHKAQFWNTYSSLFTLMICRKDSVLMQNYLLATLRFSQQPLALR